MLTDVLVVLLAVAAGGVALTLGLALAVGLHSRGAGRGDSGGGRGDSAGGPGGRGAGTRWRGPARQRRAR